MIQIGTGAGKDTEEEELAPLELHRVHKDLHEWQVSESRSSSSSSNVVLCDSLFMVIQHFLSTFSLSLFCVKSSRAETEKGLSRKHIIEGVRGSLNRLQLDYVDIVFANKPEPNTPMEEIVRAFTHLINKDMTFYWGTSRWNSMEIMEAYSVARQFNLIPPICEQAEYNMFQREEVELSLPDINSKIGMGVMSWSPLACGILSGKYEHGCIPAQSRAALKVTLYYPYIISIKRKQTIAYIENLNE